MKTLLLIDGNAIMHRAFFALPPFKTKEGIPTNMIYGFFSMLHKAIAQFEVQYVIIAFDTPKATFREKLFKEYQAHRPKAANEFIEQIPYLRELVAEAGIISLEKEGYEADDVIGTVASHYKNNSIRVFILSGDKDILQLVDNNVFVVAPKKGISTIDVYNKEEVVAKLGVEPRQVADLKALVGDSSDNYPGAKGIGPKTALDLIARYGTLENLLKNISAIENDKVRNLLQKEKQNIIISKKLSKIVTDVKIDIPLEKARFEKFNERMKPLMEKLELSSLITRFFSQQAPAKKNSPQKKEQKDSSLDQINLFS